MIPKNLYGLRKPYPVMKHTEIDLIAQIPHEYENEMVNNMLMAAKLYSNNYRINYSYDIIKEYRGTLIELVLHANHLMFYLNIKEPDIQAALAKSGYRPELLSRINDLLFRSRLPKLDVELVSTLYSPVQIGPMEIFTLREFRIENLIFKLEGLVDKMLDLLPLAAVFGRLYDPVKITGAVGRDSRRVVLWSKEIFKQYRDISLNVRETIQYPSQFIDWSSIGYPFKWFFGVSDPSTYAKDSNESRSSEDTYEIITALTENFWFDVGMEDLYIDSNVWNGNLKLMAREFSHISQDMDYGKAVSYNQSNNSHNK